MRYPASFINRVKQHFRLSEVISRRVPLKRYGREYKACCPFHQETTPSFTVNDEKGFYHCFGCGAHGDAITFLMEHDRLHYVEAVETLAKDAGIPLPEPDKKLSRYYDQEEKLLGLMDAAAAWFRDQLYGSVGHSARLYLHERGLERHTCDEFGIGYAPQKRDGLKFAMQRLGYTETQMVDAGLLIKVEGKPTYDRFRGRIIFPIARLDGRIVAFGGRHIDQNAHGPKYLNSPETLIFKKQEVLYNLHNVRRIAKDAPYIVVVEGYMDAIILHSHGIPYAVAPLGTAFGEQHLQLLWRYSTNPILCFDGDKAGQKAMLRAADVALPHIRVDCLLRFCGLPNGEDPDSFVRSSGVQSLETLFKRAMSVSELLWNVYISNRRFKTPEQLATAEQALMKTVNRIQDSGLRRRITTSFQNRIWHISKQQMLRGIRPEGREGVLPVDSTKLHVASKNPLVPALEQVFAIVVRYPALLNNAEVEHAFYEWDWSETYCADCIAEMLKQTDLLSSCRYVMAEFLTREFPTTDMRLQQHYSQGVIPTQLYGQDEQLGLEAATALFHKLKRKVEQTVMTQELSTLAGSGKLSADEKRAEQLLELIKLQQKALLHASNSPEDSYI